MTSPVSIRVNNDFKQLILKCDMSLEWSALNFLSKSVRLSQLAYQTFVSQSVKLCQFVSWSLSVHQSHLISQSIILSVSQSDFVSYSIRLCQLVSQTLSVSQSDFFSKSVRLCQLVSWYFLSLSFSLKSLTLKIKRSCYS